MSTPNAISDRVLRSVLAGQLTAGARLGELQLCTLFDATRASVREALTCLSVRGVVKASARRGWYLVDLSADEAAAAFQARHVIESGLVRWAGAVTDESVKRLQAHIQRQKDALAGTDTGLRSFLLGDFHVCLAECLGNAVLAETVRDLTVRTMLVAVHHQSDSNAEHSFEEHAAIVDAIARGDLALAESLVSAHLTTWRTKLPIPAATEPDPLAGLRQALQPVQVAH